MAPALIQADKRRHLHTLWTIWVVAGLLLLLTWLQIATQVSESRERELTSADRDLANLTRVSLEHADRTLHSADQVIRFVRARYLELGDQLDLIKLTEQRIIDAENFPQVGIIDARGMYRLANRPIASPLDLSDREHFRVHVASTEDQLFVSKPVLGRATGKWSIQLTRRITGPDGSFGGVVVLSIDPGYFARFYGELRLGPQGASTLLGVDGIARARRAGEVASYGDDLSKSVIIPRLRVGEMAGSYTTRSVVDNVERLFHFRRMSRFPLVVIVGQGLDDVLANHRRNREALLLQGTLVSLLVLALAGAVTRHLVRLRSEFDARIAVQRQVQDRTAQLDAIFALSPDGFVSFDADGRIQQVNPAFVQMTGTESIDFQGMGEARFLDCLAALCQPGTRPAALGAAQGATQAPPVRATRLHLVKGRKVLQVGSRTSQFSTVSKVYYFRDVTHENEVDQIKSEFLSTAAHELRTPMASVYGFAEVLMTQDLSEDESREFVKIIFEQSGHMANILDELLDLARMEARRGKDFKLVMLDLKALTRDVLRAFRHPADRPPPELDETPGPLLIRADAGKLQQAVLNVLSNAYKYSPAGGRVEVDIACRTGPDQVGVRITDHGIGMTAEQVQHVCERFYRADKSGKLPGSGLGMSIVKEIVELHQGQVEITSTPRQGTTVTLWLPFSYPEEMATAGAAA